MDTQEANERSSSPSAMSAPASDGAHAEATDRAESLAASQSGAESNATGPSGSLWDEALNGATELLLYAFRTVRRLVVLVVGLTVVLIGLVFIITPGPAFVVVPLGLAILAVEFAWARRLLKRMKDRLASALDSSKAEDTHGPADGAGGIVEALVEALPGTESGGATGDSSEQSRPTDGG